MVVPNGGKWKQNESIKKTSTYRGHVEHDIVYLWPGAGQLFQYDPGDQMAVRYK